MQAFVFIVVLLLAQTALAQDEMHDFKGIKLGATFDEVKTSNQNLSCGHSSESARLLSDQSCMSRAGVKETVAGVPANYLSYRFYSERLASVLVSFSSRDFEQVRVAMTEKFGPPTSVENTAIRTRIGAEYSNSRITWDAPGSQAVLQKYSSTIENGTLSLSTKESAKEFVRRRGEAGQKGAKDL